MSLEGLNDCQKRAVKTTKGPLLIIAGAGSGKTRVLTHRIAYLIEHENVNPFNILAITFTNKAAKEMKERVCSEVEEGGQVWVSTFHSTCVRILRRFIDRIGYDTNFTIYDTDDQKSVIKEACKKLQIDTKMLKERYIMSSISSAKDEMMSPDEMEQRYFSDYNQRRIAAVYREYQNILKTNNALDFDDLIYKTVELFDKCPEVLDYYQERFQYIMVDEYQDTNTVQFYLIEKLARKYNNLCVVGDDDQSIYKFRGANIGNILNFEKTFPSAKVIKLEQNYRSTQTILDAANGVIANNVGRKTKALWTDNAKGEKIKFSLYDDASLEADGIVSGIADSVRDGWNYDDIAILYRTNAQSRLLEEKLIYQNIPYRIYGGVNFYQRKEIKDILAYLKTVDNGMDGQAVKRIINVPKRGIGATTIERVQQFADMNYMTFWDALCNAKEIPGIGRGLSKVENFVNLILSFKAKKEFMSIEDLTNDIIENTGYIRELEQNETKEEALAREENIDELVNKIISFELSYASRLEEGGEEALEEKAAVNTNAGATLGEFLSEVALVADIDNLDQSDNRVVLMTLHSAKGLEFPIVYMSGLEDGLFPSFMSITSGDMSDLEEERRLCYVGITRAKKILNITSAKQRMVHGETQINRVSRFVGEIPKELVNVENKVVFSKKAPIKFGGQTEDMEPVRYDFRARTKSYLTGGSQPSGGAYSSGSHSGTSYSKVYAAPSKSTVKDVGNAAPNKRVGFGKEFPFGVFDKAGSAKTSASSVADAYRAVKPGVSKALREERENNKTVAEKLGYDVGDTVSHIKFGQGKVTGIEKGTKDYLVMVEFEKFGTKKMLAGFAKLKKE